MSNADDMINVKSLGATGDGQVHYLRERFATIEDARTPYPRATDLGQDTLDWAAIQTAIDQ